jgi:Ca2+-binding EF-hand superfamily protein
MLDEAQMLTLFENKEMMLTIFKFLDTDDSGTIDIEEFRVGIDLLNRRLPISSHFKDHVELFETLDIDNSGSIDIEEFNQFFTENDKNAVSP